MSATVFESLPPFEPPPLLAAVDVSSVKGGGSPGSNTLVDPVVVVVVELTDELVDSERVVVVVLLVGLDAVVDVDLSCVVVVEAGDVAESCARGRGPRPTPAIPDRRSPWNLQ